MGPHVFACGNTTPHVCAAKGRQASMGPHVFACGNQNSSYDRTRYRWLQWGRTFLRAEIGWAPSRIDRRLLRLQWGRTFLRAEISLSRPAYTFGYGASMGPHVFACGNAPQRPSRLSSRRASMGPHVFACGNAPLSSAHPVLCGQLQWGPTFLRAEIL